MTLSELGSALRGAREERGQSLEDIASELRIPLKVLRGIEEGGESLPRTIFVLNFIRQYAKRLGKTPEEVSEMTSGLEGFESVDRPSAHVVSPCVPVRRSVLPGALGSILKTCFVLAVVGASYAAYVHFFASREPVVPVDPATADRPAVGASSAVPVPVPAAPGEPAQSGSAVSPQEAAPSASAPAPVPAAVSPAPSAALPPVQPAPSPSALVTVDVLKKEGEPGAAESAPPAVAGQDRPAIPEGMHQVEVISDAGDCWMGFEPDGKKQQRTLRKGDTYSMTFRDSLVIRLGNARAVRVLYDGVELDRSTSPRVVTMSFPPHN